MSRRSLETSTPAKSRAVVFVVVGSKSFLLCHSRPVLADTDSPRLRTKGDRQLFGLSLLVLNGKGATTWRHLRGLDGPGPRSVCRAHPADFTTANKIQGPELLRPGPPRTSGLCSEGQRCQAPKPTIAASPSSTASFN